MKVDFNIIKDTSNKTKVIVFGIITVLVSLIGLTYSWVANWLVGTSNDMSLTAASLYLNYRGTSPTILAYLAPGETVEKNFQITNYNDSTVTYNLTWESVQNLFNPTSEIIYTVSEKTLGEIVSARTAPSSDVNVARNISIGPGETQYLTLTLTFVLDEERDQSNNIGNYFVGDITIDQNNQTSLDYTEIYANDVLVNSIPNVTTFKFDDKRSWCTDGTTISFNTANSTFSYTNLTSTTSCKTYFYTSKDFAYIAPTTSAPSPYHTYNVPYDGWYEIEAWGAQGGYQSISKGAYTSGKIELEEGETIYVYVGEGLNAIANSTSYNGGTSSSDGTPGGGATDIRLVNGVWYDNASLNSRIMVAGGSGSGSGNNAITKGAAGGLIGYNGGAYNDVIATGGTQKSAGIRNYNDSCEDSLFGVGNVGCAGGGGYYGGGGATCVAGAGGGSSYISGHTGCVAIASASLTDNPRTPRTGTGGVSCETGTTENSCSIHYSNKYFKDTKMIDGTGYLWTYQKGIQEKMPNPNGGYYDLGVGHSGNGYARINYIPNLATHKMTFNLAGGIQSKDYDGEYYEGYNYYIENPTKYSHHFTGWVINGIGTKMNNNILTVGVSNADITATWGASYTLTINPDGGICNVNIPDFMAPGQTLSIPTPTKEGYTLTGWTITATDGSGTSTGSTISETTFTMGTKNTTLTANWSLKTYTITYDLKGAAQVNNPTTYNINSGTFTLINPSAPNCTFLGWTGSNGTTPSTSVTITVGDTGNKSYSTNWSCSTTFEYTNGEQTFPVPLNGKYRLEVWGASSCLSALGRYYTDPGTSWVIGYSFTVYGGKGGYAIGEMVINNLETPNLYINIGGQPVGTENGQNSTGGYNGGGTAHAAANSMYGNCLACGGGGATHIATASGVLSALSSNQSAVLIAAGGGGGYVTLYSSNSGGGSGGGIGTASTCSGGSGTFGQGGSYTGSYGAGGGGGWFGGCGTQGVVGGTGGSGYIGNANLINKSMYCNNCTASSASATLTNNTGCSSGTPTVNCAKEGHGYARITYVP